MKCSSSFLLFTAVTCAPALAAADPRSSSHLDGRVSLATLGDGTTVAVAIDGDGTDETRAIRYWDLATGKELRASRAAREASSVAVTGDGAIVAAIVDYRLRLYTARTGKGRRTMAADTFTREPSLVVAAPVGDLLAVVDGEQLVLVDAGSRTVTARVDVVAEVSSLAFAPDGQTLAAGTTTHAILIVDLASGQVSRTIEGPEGGVTALAWSPAGDVLAAGVDADDSLWLFDASFERLAGPRKRPAGIVFAVAFSRDGEHLAVGGRDANLRIYSTSGWKQRVLLENPGDDVTALAWSGDGNNLASGSRDGELRFWAPFGE